MADLYPEIEISQDQAEAIARGLYAVAKADGDIHPSEAALIADFFGAATDDVAALAALERAPAIEGSTLAAQLPTVEHRTVFVKTAILLAYADGGYGKAESALIAKYATDLGLAGELPKLEGEVKNYLLASLSGIKNVDAVVEVTKGLKV